MATAVPILPTTRIKFNLESAAGDASGLPDLTEWLYANYLKGIFSMSPTGLKVFWLAWASWIYCCCVLKLGYCYFRELTNGVDKDRAGKACNHTCFVSNNTVYNVRNVCTGKCEAICGRNCSTLVALASRTLLSLSPWHSFPMWSAFFWNPFSLRFRCCDHLSLQSQQLSSQYGIRQWTRCLLDNLRS